MMSLPPKDRSATLTPSLSKSSIRRYLGVAVAPAYCPSIFLLSSRDIGFLATTTASYLMSPSGRLQEQQATHLLDPEPHPALDSAERDVQKPGYLDVGTAGEVRQIQDHRLLRWQSLQGFADLISYGVAPGLREDLARVGPWRRSLDLLLHPAPGRFRAELV